MNKLSRSNSGQVLLVTLLIMAVVLTIGLSLISRSITDVRISEQTEDAARAYSAAEAGIEEALISGSSRTTTFEETGSKYSVAVSGFGEGGTEYVFPQNVSVNEIQTFWFAKASDLTPVYNRNKVHLVWGKSGTSSSSPGTPAIEVMIYYKDGATYKVGRFALDPNSGRTSNSFCKPGGVASECVNIESFLTSGETFSDGRSFQFKADLNLEGAGIYGAGKTLLFSRFRLFYSTVSQPIGVKVAGTAGSGNFTAQGTKIESTGQAGQATRKVEVVRSNPAPPEIFDFVLYSGGDLVK